MPNNDLLALRRVAASGVQLIANVSTIWGGENVFLTPEEALAFGSNPDAAAARHFSVAPDVYRAWLEAEGLVRCDGQTVRGTRCANYISGSGFDKPAEWHRVKQTGERCVVHGGPPSGGRCD